MIYRNPDDFKKAVTQGVLVGLDYSKTSIGVSVSDVAYTIASPLCTLQNPGHQRLYAMIQNKLEDRVLGGWVIGWPLQFNGEEGAMCPSIQRCAAQLSSDSGAPALLFDERFTTKIALSLLSPMDHTRAKEKKKHDQMAASVLLTSFLDSTT